MHALGTRDPVAVVRHFKCEACGAWFTVRTSAALENLGCPNCDADARNVRRAEALEVAMRRALDNQVP